MFFNFSLNLKIKTIKQAASWRFITKLNIESLITKIAYSDVKKVVVDQITYVCIFALGFPFHKSFMVGKKPENVINPPILYRNVII